MSLQPIQVSFTLNVGEQGRANIQWLIEEFASAFARKMRQEVFASASPKPVTAKSTTESILLTIEEVAKLLKISQRNVRRLSGLGQLPKPVMVGRLIRWRKEELKAWMEAGGSVQ